jgi:hypothetical protein
MTIRLIWIFISAIPDLIKLLNEIEKVRITAETQRKTTDDVKTIHQAFANKDAAAIAALFRGSPSADSSPASTAATSDGGVR